MRVGHDDVQVGLEERRVVVAAVPEDDVGFLLRLAQDGLVVDAGVDDAADGHVRLVLLHLLDGAVVLRQVGDGGEALHGAGLLEVAVGHRVPHGDDLLARLAEDLADAAARLALAAAGAHGAHADDRLGALQLGQALAQHREVGTRRIDDRREAHHLLVRAVAVGHDTHLGAGARNQLRQRGLVLDGDALGIVRPGQRSRVAPAVDVGNLRGREGDHIVGGIVPVDAVEVVEIAPGGAQDDDLDPAHAVPSGFRP
jgi:hypothetical protein